MACRVSMIRRPTGARALGRRVRWLVAASAPLVIAGWAVADAAEPRPVSPVPTPRVEPTTSTGRVPPEVIADFTRRVQPLVLNRCAAGACHGGPHSPEPRFIRPDARGGIDRRSTHANLHAFLAAIGSDRDAGSLAKLLAKGHPATPASARLVAAPLSSRERLNLDRWLHGVRLAEQRHVVAPAVRQAAHTEPAAPPPNRFKNLLESAANPIPLPPPEEPRGVIFPRDVPPEPATSP